MYNTIINNQKDSATQPGNIEVGSQVKDQMNRLNGRLELLMKIVDELESALTPVTRDPILSEKKTEVLKERLVPLADNLREFVERLEVECDRIDYIIKRIEL